MVQMAIEFAFCGTVVLCRVAALSTSSLQECTDELMEIGSGWTWRLSAHHYRSECTHADPQTDEGSNYFVVCHPGSNEVHKVHEKSQLSSIWNLSRGFSQGCPPWCGEYW